MAHHQKVSNSQLGQAGSWDSPYQQNSMQKFLNGKPKILGVAQILIGLMKMCLWAMWKTAFHHIYEDNIISPRAHLSFYPIWGPLCFYISGVLSIVAGRKLTINLIRGSLAMNIISAITSGVGLALLTVDVTDSTWYMRYFKASGGISSFEYENATLGQVFLIAILILSLLEVCITLTLSAFGCMVACFVTQVVVHLAPADNMQSEVTPEHEYEELTYPYV
ncbi:membrane-spanning 4-domains subfamily A member 4A-like isoform X1 [Choloepus didactylus]|uniref:membrane-spanning 4-domains subfamily A member 4A-like isoform X1 n=1 Tax=Choloepus didactylus TaxID=27675 RepID=UPI0018A049F1|nr:membrane-spanning 4-domains subfamily A member 4A-like isoform X1 [Choloepus didactylus]XP_037696544.1 membrane-spanning 4-domains subfamily A member 4A-like isoform X1 [Choloepus didactylus]XP_037696545.1 membrane-spanning 4-domains subfamily A member 4A-like isoform X1 [Choloepus didactylus]XP_037696546.1 membrane-spanning 4-domains subfamily A member 4A-like isoform X1 [Choloepus didactylus]